MPRAGGLVRTARMIYKLAPFVALAFAFASCTSTDFQSWEGGNSVVQGHGGTRKVVDGMDVVKLLPGGEFVIGREAGAHVP